MARAQVLQPTVRREDHVREERHGPASGEPTGATLPVRAPRARVIPRLSASTTGGSLSTSRSGSKVGSLQAMTASGS
jgi:hypothetical protein